MTLSSELTFTKDISLSRRAKPSSASKTVATKVKLVAKKVKFVATKIKSIATKVKFVEMLRFFLHMRAVFGRIMQIIRICDRNRKFDCICDRPNYMDFSQMRGKSIDK